jgi:hypothetical protein
MTDAHTPGPLIAAAPDLLAACLAMLSTWGGDDEDEIIAARDRARAAVSKAIEVAPSRPPRPGGPPHDGGTITSPSPKTPSRSSSGSLPRPRT